ncbi:neuraminidase-like domain-containing protein [Sorangium sp. So ce216]
MNKLTFPLKTRMSGPAVADLQDALRLLLDQGLLLKADAGTRKELSAALKKERAEERYGTATGALVGALQEERRLRVSKAVDEPTAKAMNSLLKKLGALASPRGTRATRGSATTLPDARYTVVCRAVDARGKPIAGLRVEALDADPSSPADPLGEPATTGEDGLVTFRFEASAFAEHPGEGGPDLRFRVYRGETLLTHTLPSIRNDRGVIRGFQQQREPIELRVDKHHAITGVVLEANGLPARGLVVSAHHLGFGESSPRLGTATTDAEGRYALAYDPGATGVNLELRIDDRQSAGKQIALARPRFRAAAREVVNLRAPTSPLAPEYRRLSADLTPHVGSMTRLAGAREDGERRDLTVLSRTTGWDARLIALAAMSERLAADADVGLPQEALYGMLRAGLPSDRERLAQVGAGAVEHALKVSRDAGIVTIDDRQLAQVKDRFAAFSNKVRLAMPAPGSRSTYAELLGASGLGADVQAKFAPVFLNHRGDAAGLWESARQAGLDGAQIGKLKLQGKLAFLAGNSGPMTARLMQKMQKESADPTELVRQDFDRADRWKAELTALAGGDAQKLAASIPAAYAGDTVERRADAYAEDMARKVRLSYPTHVVGRMIERDADDAFKLGAARGDTAALLGRAAAQGFRLGETPVNAFLRAHAGVATGMVADALARAEEQMKTLQRVYQITPNHEAMPVLMSQGITSAYDVMAYSESSFLASYTARFRELYGWEPPSEEVALIYRKAQQVSSVTYNLFAIARKMDAEAPAYALSAPPAVVESVKNELLKQFPTMESLFGSMDFCECEHCRSVLSPAAYLVDLLQLVDVEPGVWGNFLAQWQAKHGEPYTAKYRKPYDALVARRPDLPHLRLTCENTQTALPYIDVVNEILEYFVAHGTLEEAAARDTGSATTAELLAEPQSVIREAYDTLRAARYPLGLPFDLWLETVRRLCTYFETPLARVLEAFRPTDDLFAPRRPFDRSSIFMESLGLSPAEVALFTDPAPLARWYELYGFASDDEARTVATDADSGQRIDLNSAKALSRRLGVTYKELVEIVQTGFVNPRLTDLTLLYKLGVSIRDARSYLADKPLLQTPDRTTLSVDDQKRWLEARAFADALDALAGALMVTAAELDAEVHAIPWGDILVLADPDAGCDFDRTTLRYADGDDADDIAFLRINLFVRLWRKLGWTIEETDRALQAFVPATAPFDAAHLGQRPLLTALVYLSHLKALDQRLRAGKGSRLKLLALWSDVATTGTRPLYAQLFLTPGVLKSDPVFDDPLGQYLSSARIAAVAAVHAFEAELENVAPADLIDIAPAALAAHPGLRVSYDALQEVQRLSFEGVLTDAEKALILPLSPSVALSPLLDAVQARAAEYGLVKGHTLALQGALGLTSEEIRRILEHANLAYDTAALSLANVSLLYRHGLLAKALGITVRDLISLVELSGLDPFEPLLADPLTQLDDDHPFTQTLRFVEVAEQVRESGVKIEDLDYLLRHRYDETGKYRPDREGLLASLKALAEGVRAIRAEHAVPADPGAMTEEALRQKLGLALPADAVGRLLAMMNGSVELTATRTGIAAGDRLLPEAFAGEAAIQEVRYNGARQEQSLTFRGVLFDARKNTLMASLPAPVPPAPHAASPLLGELLDDVQRLARSFFDTHLRRQAPDVQPASGFLDDGDYALLFDPDLALGAGETEQDRIRRRRAVIAKAFLPFLQERLIRQLVVQTMTAQTAAEPALVESLITDDRLLASPGALLDALSATGARGITAAFYASTDESGPATTLTLAEADTGARDAEGALLRPPGSQSARFEGYLEVPAPGAYRFTLVLDKQGAEADLEFDHLPARELWSGTAATDGAVLGEGPAEFLELKPGVLYRFTLHLRELDGGDARLLVQGETLPRGGLGRISLHPAAGVERAARATTLLRKALQLVQSLGLNEREIRYLLTHAAAFDGLDLSALPASAAEGALADAPALFGQFLRLAAYARARRDLAGGTDELIGVFELNETGVIEDVYSRIATLTRRDPATVRATARALFAAPAFASEAPLQRLWEALRIVERFGVPVGSLLGWTRIVGPAATPEQRFAIARDFKEAIKARFDAETWQRVAQPIFDDLRRRRRDALVAHVLDRLHLARVEQMYEHFLIDPGMEPVVQTSRVRLAIASLQLFVQRCLLNLEREVHPSTIPAEQWEWMKRYRVWEANRKIFLFPENWLEPEFRDDKTSLFTELEGALLQGDVSSDLVEDAFLDYLRKLDQIARLDIVAMHVEDHPDPAQRTLHVIGRTYSEPYTYFYRRYAHAMWTPWEPVSAEIEGDHLAPVVWRDRLYLFWVTFLVTPTETNVETQIDPTKTTTIPAVRKNVEAHLHWSEHLKGQWTSRESGGVRASRPIVRIGLASFDPRAVLVHVSTSADGGVYVHLGSPIHGAFYLAGRNAAPEEAAYGAEGGPRPDNPYSASAPRATRYAGSGALTVRFAQRITTEPGKDPDIATPTILAKGVGAELTLLPCDNRLSTLGVSEDAYESASNPQAVKAAIESGMEDLATLMKPVFYQDNKHTLFVEPDVTEQTIEDWQEWVTHTPDPGPEILVPPWLDDLVVIPDIPWKDPIGDPWDPVINPGDPAILIEKDPTFDWLLNPATGLVFDRALISRTGGLEAEIAIADARAVAGGGVPVSVHAGSALGSGKTIVFKDAGALALSGLTQAPSGLNVVGGAGFNAALGQNFQALSESSFGQGQPAAPRAGLEGRRNA